MPRRIANTQLNARTIDILNVIRENASYSYQNTIPEISDTMSIPRVGELLFGNPVLCNEFLNALVNRIALVVIQSATFNNPYADLKKGYIEYGATVEEIFVSIIQAQEFSVEKAPTREFKRNLPKVDSVFHTMNWRVLYPITIQREDLRRAFLDVEGVETLITTILNQVYTSASYDEYLLFKYLIIKACASGKITPVAFDASDMKNAAVAFRGYSNELPFMSKKYNEYGVHTNTPKDRQQIFMDSHFNAQFDVEVLASAFNMERADFMGRLRLIDDFTTFDNERFAVIRENSDGLEEVTAAELALMADVKAILIDENWFQVYDNENIMTDTPVNSGLYWNYFYHTWKIISHSPFSNAIVFVDDGATITTPATLTFTVAGVVTSEVATIYNLEPVETDTLAPTAYSFVQDATATEAGIAVHRYGSIIIPADFDGENGYTPTLTVGSDTYTGTALSESIAVGDTITFTKG